MYYLLQENTNILVKLTAKVNAWWDAFVLKLPNLAVAILVIVFAYFLGKFLSKLLLKILRKKMKNRSVRRVLSKILYGIILVIGFFLALGILDLDKALTSVLAGAGVVALAIGLALQGTLSNTFSGIMLSFLPRIKIGDFIETDEHSGFVHDISLRNLVLRRPDNHYVIMPNSKFIEEPFVNYSLVKRGRVTVHSRVAYGSDLRTIKTMVLKEFEDKFPKQIDEKIEFYYIKFNDSSIDFMVRFWIDYVKKSQMYTAQDEAILLINDLFHENNITIPFPTHHINVKEDIENQPKNLNHGDD
ncbi:mechanosensitive ion channel protein [Patiriisocius marinistellae]|uniref:Mechanosensitive ion channel protein n=1 Tax=Patiriisocius marinistellae TaxID=2494560 RepID=A0A5J4G0W2_9FLAO|nr:mechanosensitive ion channel family protein [Patiriisocius marinistellae]GEQ87184.1 mechanosensitive ion channel protein [Patiriisocius marinistellae]